MLAHDVFCSFARDAKRTKYVMSQQASRVYDVTDTDCWTKNGKHSRSCFSVFRKLVFIKRDEKLSDYFFCIILLFHSHYRRGL